MADPRTPVEPLFDNDAALREMAKHAHRALNAAASILSTVEDGEIGNETVSDVELRCTQIACGLFTLLRGPEGERYESAPFAKAALAAPLAVQAADEREARYRFLLGFLIERGVLTDKRYRNGTWSLQGIYGVDDSGLRGAGMSPEEALDNAMVMVNLDPVTRDKFWGDTNEALAARAQLAQAPAALTYERIHDLIPHARMVPQPFSDLLEFARAIERAHGITSPATPEGEA